LVKASGKHHSAGSTFACYQQFAHCMTAFDLFTAQIAAMAAAF